MNEHTPEPWNQCSGGPLGEPKLLIGVGAGYETVAWMAVGLWDNKEMQSANARRIVACVNACRGLSTETLETFGNTVPNGIAYHLEQANRERDEARAMVKELAVAAWFMQTRLEEWVGGIDSKQDEIVIQPVTDAILKAKALLHMTIDDMLQAAYRG